MSQLFRTKSVEALVAASQEEGKRLKRTLGPWSLVALGLGAVIGSGIFILSGTAAAGDQPAAGQQVTTTQQEEGSQDAPRGSVLDTPVLTLLGISGSGAQTAGRPGAGPGIALSFLLVAIACGFAALCFAELASMIPVAGSTYTYAYATMGELVAWIIGWDLILEYAVSNMAVAVGFSAYLNDICDNVFGYQIPRVLSEPMIAGGEFTGAWFNLPALVVLLVLTVLLVRGVRESARANNVMVLIKLGAILLFIFAASRSVDPANWSPFMPNGFQGVLTGGAIVFFTYIGFDSVSTAAEECKQPQRDMPIGIIGTLVVCAILYTSVALVLTGIADWRTLNNAAPVANALKALGMDGVRQWVSIGAVIGMISSLLVYQYGQTRVWFAMSRDRLLPAMFSRVHPVHRTPHISTWVAGLVVGIPAGIWDIGTFAELSNIGTLFAFVIVSAGVLVLRKRHPELRRGFRVPLVPVVPLIAIGCCLVLML
ncbi:MAG: amino acid permease, partial [bacterium]|nr:amino acid permease [bacterium]